MAIEATSSVRARSRIAATGGASKSAPLNPGATADWMKSGAAAIDGYQEHQTQMAKQREERTAQKSTPYRFFLKKGEEVDVVVLDDDFGPGLFEHDLTMNERFKRVNPRSGRPYDQFVTSPQQWEPDPLTPIVGKEPYYATFITVGVLQPYTNDKGVTVNYQKRLVALKGEAMELMTTIRAQQIKAGHAKAPLRGLHLLMKRGNGETSLKTGLPMFVARVSEADILETFGHPDIISEKDGGLIKPANADCYPTDYASAFPKPSADEIRKRFHLGPAERVGSAGYQSRGGFVDEFDGGGGSEGTNEDGVVDTTGFSDATGDFAADLDDDIPF